MAAFNKRTALYLGPTAQLFVMGVMLGFIGARKGRRRGCCLYMKRIHTPTFDAPLRADYVSQEDGIRPCVILLFLFLPLGLGASYKRFIGGLTTVKVPSLGGWYGLTAAPGYQRIGNGLSLLVDAYLPFWIDPT